MPLILPGIISGALFAFVTSFDEIVVILFVAGGFADHLQFHCTNVDWAYENN